MHDRQPSFWSSVPGILTGIAAVITAVVGLVTVLSLGGADDPKTSAHAPITGAAPSPAPDGASITQPDNGQDVCIEQVVKGTTTEPRGSSSLWLFVHAPRSREYFAADRATIASDPGRRNTWSATANFSGTPDDVGQTYELVVAAVSRSASDLLEVRTPGVALPGGLPAGSRQLDKIFVTTSRC